MNTHSKDLIRNLHGIRYGELTHLLLALAQEKQAIMRHIATDLLKKGNQLGSWSLKQVIEEPHLD